MGTRAVRRRYAGMSETFLRKAKSVTASASSGIGTHMPESLADRFMLCPVCREEYDMRNLDEVLQHLHASADEIEGD